MRSYPNYENTIEEHDETAANDDSDSGIDSLYECIKFKTNDNRRQQTASGPDFYSLLDYFLFHFIACLLISARTSVLICLAL